MVVRRVSMAVSVAVFVVAGCTPGTGGNTNGGGDTNGGGGDTGGGGGGSTGSGGSTGTTGDTTSTDTGGCPAYVPKAGDPCSEMIECVYQEHIGICVSKMEIHASCTEGHWHVLQPAVCEPLPADALCDPVGTWAVTATGPWEPPDDLLDPYTGPFEVGLLLGQNGLVYAELGYAKLSADGCTLQAWKLLYSDCWEMDGQSFCSSFDRQFTLDFSTMPAVGTATIQLGGEISAETTAPIEATKLP